VLVPEGGNTSVELTELGGEDDVVSVRQTVEESGALLARALDLRTDLMQLAHVDENDFDRSAIPLPSRSNSGPSAVAQLADSLLVEPEEVADLVEDRDLDLAPKLVGIRERPFERPPVDDDLVG
jgi:hypothetical protein